MAILAPKSRHAPALEIELPAEDVEKAFAAVTKSYVKRAAIPGFRKAGRRVGRRSGSPADQGRLLGRVLPDALAAAIRAQARVLGRHRIDAQVGPARTNR
jgi:FKBP-type peptidyl-prolyl cis-trans isomerase (trigger factor)